MSLKFFFNTFSLSSKARSVELKGHIYAYKKIQFNSGPFAVSKRLIMNTIDEVTSSEYVAANKKALLWVQDSTALAFGIGAGILQLESFKGFAMFVVGYLSVALLYIIWICRLQPAKYYQSPINDIFIESFVRELTGYVMAWTFSYALVG